MSDRLDEAFRALREEQSGATRDAATTRARLLLAASKRRRVRPTARLVLLPLAAALLLGTAWAAQSGALARAPAALGALFAPANPPTPSAPPTAGADANANANANANADANANANLAPAPSRAPARPPSLPDAESALYQRAHDAHFVDRDPTRAITAWDAYLAAYPSGRFAPEAHYNRALMLIRAGRRDEARAALAPFAEGRFGSYRQSEAKALLEALSPSAP